MNIEFRNFGVQCSSRQFHRPIFYAEAVNGVALWMAAVVGEAEVLEFRKQVVAHARGAAVVEVVVDHHARHPDEIADELNAHTDEYQTDDLAGFAGGQTR